MLRKFKVSYFKGFGKDFELDFTKTKGYEFNEDCIKNGCVNNVIIYGKNGTGKSNLALAIFDILSHLTDRPITNNLYTNYLNFNFDEKDEHRYGATFFYEFEIDSKIVTYSYKKTDYKTLVWEIFKIEDKEYASINRGEKISVYFEGYENLSSCINNPEISVLKYVKDNVNLILNDDNITFYNFFKYLDKMFLYNSLKNTFQDRNEFLNFILEKIVSKNKVKDFENFLNESGIECKLSEYEMFDKKIVFKSFSEIASDGTVALTHLYYCLMNLNEPVSVSFLFLDDFDSFYHSSLSRSIVERLKETGVQFVLTTHNTSTMTNDLLRPDCYFVMTKDNIQSFADSTDKDLKEAHNLERMYKSGAFGF